MSWFKEFLQKSKKFNDINSSITLLEQYFLQNQDEKAIELVHWLADNSLSDEQEMYVHMYHGWLLYRQGKFAEAISHAELILQRVQTGYLAGKAYHLLGVCHSSKLEDKNAHNQVAGEDPMHEFQKAIELLAGYPDQLAAVNSQARLLANLNEVDEAIRILESFIQSTLEHSLYLGWSYATLGELWGRGKCDWQKSVENYKQSVAILDKETNTHAWIYAELAEGYFNLREYDRTIASVQKILAMVNEETAPDILLSAHKIYALGLEEKGEEFKLVAQQYQLALKYSDQFPDEASFLYRRLGNVYAAQRQYRQAFQAFERSLSGASEDDKSSIYWNMGTVAYDWHKYDQAIRCYSTAIQHTDVTSDRGIKIYLQLGHSYFQVNKYKEAAQSYREALKYIDPQDARRPELMKYLYTANELS